LQAKPDRRGHQDRADDRDQVQRAERYAERPDEVVTRQDIRQDPGVWPPHHELHRLEEQAQAHGRDHDREQAGADQAVEDQRVDEQAEDHGGDHGGHDGDDGIQVELHQESVEEVRAEDHELALGEVHDPGRAEQDDETDADQCVQAA